MRLVYDKDGTEVKVGDRVTVNNQACEIMHFTKPHKPSSSGKVAVKAINDIHEVEFYVSVIEAEWIEREDR